MINIIDTDNKVRVINSIKKIIHTVKDKDGKEISTDYVEVMVVGKEREWVQYYLLVEFLKLNPGVEI